MGRIPDGEARREKRLEAAAGGRRRYLGNPCSVCGLEERYTSTGNCTSCTSRRRRQQQDAIRELLRKAEAEAAEG